MTEETELLPIDRVDSHVSPTTGVLNCPPPPCVVSLVFDNHYSWFSDKSLTYHAILVPPSEVVAKRAMSSRLSTIAANASVDVKEATARMGKSVRTAKTLEVEVEELEEELKRKREALERAKGEEVYLRDRVTFREKQMVGVKERLERIEKDIQEAEKREKEEEREEGGEGGKGGEGVERGEI